MMCLYFVYRLKKNAEEVDIDTINADRKAYLAEPTYGKKNAVSLTYGVSGCIFNM
jgi:hypothetical protein